MIDKNQLKAQGLAFGQAFQTAFKVSVMYAAEHAAAERSVQQSYVTLSSLLKQTRQFTFGFVNRRVLLNHSLISQNPLTHLEIEFSKREIAAVSFDAGVSLEEFKRSLALVTTKPNVIAEQGGIKRFLERNPIEGVRVLPAQKPQSRDGDTDIGMDAESYLTAQAILDPEGQPTPSGLDLLLQVAGIDKPKGSSGNARDILDLASKGTQNALADPEGNVPELLTALSQMLEGLKPDHLLSCLSPEKQNELRGHPAQDIAADLVEDATVEWAAESLAAPSGGPGLAVVEEEVLRALLRGLKATRVAERVLQKLAKLVQDAHLPAEVYSHIQEEVRWFTLPPNEKHAHLMRLDGFTTREFRHLVDYAQEMMNRGKFGPAAEVAGHYFGLLHKVPAPARAEELKRAPELLRTLAAVETLELIHTCAEPMVRELLDESRIDWECHRQAANCLVSVAQHLGRLEDFEFVHKIALDLKRSQARDRAQHSDCCGAALTGLLAMPAIELLIELYLQRRGDADWAKTVTSLLQAIGPPAGEIAFRHLEDEAASSNRMRLIRLIGKLGTAAIEAARKRLTDARWYVARNACYILGDLGDPEISEHLRATLRHSDGRVQQAAVTAIIKGSEAGRGEVLGDVLPTLQASVLELALDELMFLKDAASVAGLEKLIFQEKESKIGVADKAVMILASIPSDRAAEVLYKVLCDPGQTVSVRRAAFAGLCQNSSTGAMQLVARLSSLPPDDPLWADLKKVMEQA